MGSYKKDRKRVYINLSRLCTVNRQALVNKYQQRVEDHTDGWVQASNPKFRGEG